MTRDEEAEALHRRAKALVEIGRYAQALPLLEKAVGLAPDEVAYVSDLALVLDRLERPKDSLAVIERVLALHPTGSWGHRFQSYLFRQVGRPEEAWHAARRAVALAPHSPAAHRRLAHAARDSDRVDEIRAAIEYAVACAPQDASMWRDCATLLRELGDAEGGRRALREALRLAPTDAWLRVEHAQGLAGQAQLEAFREALALDPVHQGALAGYAKALAGAGEHAEARAVGHSLVELTKGATWSLNVMLVVTFADGTHARWLDEAWGRAVEDTRLAPTDDAAWERRVWVALHRADREGAVAAARVVLDRDPADADRVETVGGALWGTPEAVEFYRRAQSLQPQRGWFAAATAQVSWECGRREEALAAAREAVVVHPREPHAWRVLGALAAAAREPGWLDAYVLPRSLGLHEHEAQEASGHLARAREDWDRAAACYARAELHNGLCCCSRVSAGLAHLRAGDSQGARERLARAEVYDPFCGCAGARDELRRGLEALTFGGI